MAGVCQDISCLVGGEEVSGERKVLLIYAAPALFFIVPKRALSPEHMVSVFFS
jgi:hypothetical protein